MIFCYCNECSGKRCLRTFGIKATHFAEFSSRILENVTADRTFFLLSFSFVNVILKLIGPKKPDFSRFFTQMTAWIIERLDRKLADAIGSNIVEKCDVTLSRAIQPHSTSCTSYVSSHISLSLSSTIHIDHVLK